jgi:hypothetical protein
MSINILLEPEQETLLIELAEAMRNVPSDKREPFWAVAPWALPKHLIKHQGLPNGEITAYTGDFQLLLSSGFITTSLVGEDLYEVTAEGFSYYRELRQRSGEPIERMQNIVKNYFAAPRFQKKYPLAYKKWTDAETLLWSSDSESQLTAIGHFCREALQEFATALVVQYMPEVVDANTDHTKNRIKAAVNQHAGEKATTVPEFLDALYKFWDKVSDLDQRQEHGGQKGGKSLVWEDGRRAVFQTAVVMFEVDSFLSHKL